MFYELVGWFMSAQPTKWKYKRSRYSRSLSQPLIVNHFLKGYTGLSFVCWLIDWLVLTVWFFNVPSLNNCLWDALLQIDAKEHSRNRSVRLCVLSDFTNGKRPFRFAVKRTNVLSLLCYSGHLSDGTHMGVHPCQCFTHNWKYFQDNILVSTDHESAHSSGH